MLIDQIVIIINAINAKAGIVRKPNNSRLIKIHGLLGIQVSVFNEFTYWII